MALAAEPSDEADMGVVGEDLEENEEFITKIYESSNSLHLSYLLGTVYKRLLLCLGKILGTFYRVNIRDSAVTKQKFTVSLIRHVFGTKCSWF